MAIFKGSGVAIVTPFKEDGSIDYDKLDELIDYHCENKTDSIIICGTTGESATMTEEEHMDCVKFAIERTKKRIPVVAGTGSNCTRTAIDMSKEAAESVVGYIRNHRPQQRYSRRVCQTLQEIQYKHRFHIRFSRKIEQSCKNGSK